MRSRAIKVVVSTILTEGILDVLVEVSASARR